MVRGAVPGQERKGIIKMENENQTVHKRRVRYKGKYPKKFEEKYKELQCRTGVLVIWSSFHCGRYVYFRIDGKPGDCGSSDVCGTVYQLYDAESDRTYFIGWKLADKDFKLSGSVCTV